MWKIIRDFNNYPVWVDGAGESRIEDGKSGDTVGAVRNVLYLERRIRQRLLAQSDVERSQTYEFCGAPSLPPTDFEATLRITEELTGTLQGWFAKWLESLRKSLIGSSPGFPQEAVAMQD